MPPKAKITKDMIAEAAFRIVREEGSQKLTVRAVAEKLGCSTQPVLYYFSGIDEIKSAAYEMADGFHSEYIMPKGGSGSPLLELGMNYVRFGYEEKNLFRFLFLDGHFSGLGMGDLLDNGRLSEIIGMIASATGMSPEEAKDMFLSMFVTAHGCACLLVGNAMAFESDKIEMLLKKSLKK